MNDFYLTVECNTYFLPSVLRFEGEQEDLDVPAESSTGKSHSDVVLPPAEPAEHPIPSPVDIASDRPKRVRNPSWAVRDILSGAAADNDLPHGVQLPTTAMLEGESSDNERAEVERGLTLGDEDSTAALAKYALAAVVSDAEALEPRTLKEARAWLDWPLWEKAIEEELEMLHVAGTWVLEDAPPGANIVSSKWVFKAKKDASGNVVHYKACLVVQGYSQVPSVNYFNMYAPVAKLSSIQTVLVITN